MTDVRATSGTTADGVTLRGEIVPGGGAWAMLVHDAGEDLDVWWPLRDALAAEDWTVLAFDLRGHGGSDGDWDPVRAELDVDLGVTLARRNGAEHVTVVAGGASALITLRAFDRALAEPAFDLPDSLVLLSAGPLGDTDPMTLRGEGASKLYIMGGKDPVAEDARRLCKASIGWTLEVTVGGGDHGAALCSGASAVAVIDKVLGFLREQRTLPGPGAERAAARRGATEASG
jgi:pimeloyl-ACP methyl ester carboxylesterase